MTDQSDDDARDQDQHTGVPDSDPDHLDPAGALADAFEDGSLADAHVPADADREELRAFLEAVEAGEFDPVDPGLEATVRIVRALLDEDVDGEA
jgi:hypothetical protein